MQVIFCHIPSKTSLSELVVFAQSGVKSLFSFLRKPELVSFEILEIVDRDSLVEEFHGLVTYASPNDAEKAIEALNGKLLHGKPIKVRAYVHRSPGDRRVKAKTMGLNRPEENRRPNLDVRKRTEASPKVSGYKNRNRVHSN
jgi:hypothetical protein